MPKVDVPTIQQLKATNKKYNLNCSEDELAEYQDHLKEAVESFNYVHEVILEPDVYEGLKPKVNRSSV